MNTYRFINGRTESIDILPSHVQQIVEQEALRAQDRIAALSRRQLHREFLFNRNELHTIFHQQFPPLSEDITQPSGQSELFWDILDDIGNRIGVAGGSLGFHGSPDDSVKPKEWTGREEEPEYIFHTGFRNGDENDRIFGLHKVRTFDIEGDGTDEQIKQTHAHEGHTFEEAYNFIIPRSRAEQIATGQIERLRTAYGDVIGQSLAEAFGKGYHAGTSPEFVRRGDPLGTIFDRLSWYREPKRTTQLLARRSVENAADTGFHAGLYEGRQTGILTEEVGSDTSARQLLDYAIDFLRDGTLPVVPSLGPAPSHVLLEAFLNGIIRHCRRNPDLAQHPVYHTAKRFIGLVEHRPQDYRKLLLDLKEAEPSFAV